MLGSPTTRFRGPPPTGSPDEAGEVVSRLGRGVAERHRWSTQPGSLTLHDIFPNVQESKTVLDLAISKRKVQQETTAD